MTKAECPHIISVGVTSEALDISSPKGTGLILDDILTIIVYLQQPIVPVIPVSGVLPRSEFGKNGSLRAKLLLQVCPSHDGANLMLER